MFVTVKLKGRRSDAEAWVGMREQNQNSLIQNGGNLQQYIFRETKRKPKMKYQTGLI